MKVTIILISVLMLTGCQGATETEHSEKSVEPKTSYGQAVHKAEDLSDEAEERNKEIEKQAEGLFDDE
ncbi:MAG: hypothetical protein KDD64_06735 [Bdellovibrionales bacterium]|nr:hypothetical protein [Bdellovibrionales bacterium]